MTLVRLPLAALFWIVATDPIWSLVIVGAAAVSDAIDGRLARRALRRGATGPIARLGTWLDPLCDKLFAIAVLAALAIRLDTSLVVLLLVGARELVVVPLVAIHRLSPLRHRVPVELRASPAGKVATVAQFVALAVILLEPPAPATFVVALATAALGLFAATLHVVRLVRSLGEGAANRPPRSGLRPARGGVR